MPEVIPSLSVQPTVEDFAPAGGLVPGELVAVSAGALQGALGTVIRKSSRGSVLVGLIGLPGKVAVQIPESLLTRELAGS